MKYAVDFHPVVFCVLKQGKVIKLDKRIPALNPYAEYWIEMTHVGRTHTTAYGNIFPLAEYKILKTDSECFSWEIGHFYVVGIKDIVFHSADYITEYTIQDINGRSFKINLNQHGSANYSTHSIEKVFDLINGLSAHFDSWDAFFKSNRKELKPFFAKFKLLNLEKCLPQFELIWRENKSSKKMV